ncbi:epoxide hydrolase A-like [Capsicum annuum]|uniref:epoxide hydrolase A-like n=1 Tax=Capsicum annuum TaxID=4072 RepID=UPI001FB0CFEB|nr:epoxide hydrolase A-like [Capsicum annuum]
MEKIEHKMVDVNGINMHVAELGQGPTILFIHGFPELWYSWRHQMVYLAERGYRAVAPDLRGYGDTTGAPVNDISKFSLFHLVGDLIALLEAIDPNKDNVFVVAHDWGAVIAWHLCLFRPDKVKALVNLSVQWTGAQVKVPTKFIVGEFDLVYRIPGAKEYIHNDGFKKDVPLLEEVVVVEGAAHFVNQERPDEINKHIYDFIQKF